MGDTERRIQEAGIKLAAKSVKPGRILALREEDGLVFLSGHGCELESGEPIHRGRVGSDLTVQQGYEAARQCGINLLASLKAHLGDLDRVERIVKVLGFVNSAPDFFRQPEVMHGLTDLMVTVFGESGRHARSAIGTSVLPNNQAVEIEMIVKVRP